MNIAIIPARGGSKRIPRKNIKPFLGKPIIYYSIAAALKCGFFDEVMVSTDDIEIAQIAVELGANVPFLRSNNNSDDFATTSDVLIEVLECYRDKYNQSFQNVCCIYPTAPLLRVSHLEEGYELLQEHNLDSVFPVVPFSYPVFRGLKLDGMYVKMEWPEFYHFRSQDLETIYHDAGQWYWLKTESLINQKKLFMNKSSIIKLTDLEVQDIDTEVDFKLAELKYRLLT